MGKISKLTKQFVSVLTLSSIISTISVVPLLDSEVLLQVKYNQLAPGDK